MRLVTEGLVQQQICTKMADSGLSKFCAFLFTLVLAENGFASNAISVQISKPLGAMLQDKLGMKNLLENQISAYLRPEKSIEQYIDRIEYSEYSVLRWVAIERTKEIYTLVIHEVFDERDEINSIYDFSYLEPDDMYGKRIAEFKSLNETLELAEKEFGATADKYLPFGFLDEYLIKMEK